MRSSHLLCVAIALAGSHLSAQKLSVYVLAGQSNMQGHAKIETFDYIGDDPATKPWLDEMRGADGAPVVCDDVWISYLTGGRGGDGVASGKLTAGFGARRNAGQSDGKIGPEFTFGLQVAKAHHGPVLLIKTAWGGKSLHTDFRPPSAGAYEFDPMTIARLQKQKKDVEKARADKKAKTGVFYRKMVEHVRNVLADPKQACPEYDEKAGFELCGFVWFQGWNDMVDRGTYPNRDKLGGYDQYTTVMTHFIRDVRKDFDAPKLPFVIGVMGVNGELVEGERNTKVHSNFRKAMAAAAELEEFRGNVVAVQTAPYWDEKLEAISAKMGKVKQMARMLRTKNKKHANADGKMTKAEQREYVDAYRDKVVGAKDVALLKRGSSNAGYHYLGSAKTMAGIGRAFADAVLALRR